MIEWIKPYICQDCAKMQDSNWEDGHVATFNKDVCDYCDRVAYVCHIRNYRWKKHDSNDPDNTTTAI